MSRTTFRLVMVAYIVFGITVAYLGQYFDAKLIPSDIVQRADDVNLLFNEHVPFMVQLPIVVAMMITILMLLVAIIGFFFFWNISRYLFLIAPFAEMLFSFVHRWEAQSSIRSVLGNLDDITFWLLVYLVFCGSAKHLFVRYKSEPEQAQAEYAGLE